MLNNSQFAKKRNTDAESNAHWYRLNALMIALMVFTFEYIKYPSDPKLKGNMAAKKGK